MGLLAGPILFSGRVRYGLSKPVRRAQRRKPHARARSAHPTLSANSQDEAHEVSVYFLDGDDGLAAMGVETGGRMTMNPMSRTPLLDQADWIPVGVCKTA